MALKDWKKDYDKKDMFGFKNIKHYSMIEGVRIGHTQGPFIWSLNYSSPLNPRLHIGHRKTKEQILKFAKSYMRTH